MKTPDSPTLITIVEPGNHHGTGAALELGREIRSTGGEVQYLWLYGLPAVDCLAFPEKVWGACHLAAARRRQMLPWFQEWGAVSLRELTFSDTAWAGAVPDERERLRSATPQGIDLGEAVLSSLISHLREPRPDISRYRKVTQGFWEGGAAVFQATEEYLSNHPEVRSVVVFNGRHATMRPVIRAAERANRSTFSTEAGSEHNTYEVFEGMRHDADRIREAIERAWVAPVLSEEEKTSVADRYFELRRGSGLDSDAVRFTRHQQKEALPPTWNAARRNIAVFVSSYDECVALGDKWSFSDGVADQEDAIRKLAERLAKRDPHALLWVRIHPNLRGIENSQTRDLFSLISIKNVRVLAGDSGIDSYALARQADAVLTFGSTMGVEASHLGARSILFGPAFHQGLGACTEANSLDEVAVQLLTGKYDPATLIGVRKYGYYLSSFGQPFKEWRLGRYGEATYRGERVVGNLFLHHWFRLRMMANLWHQRRPRRRIKVNK